MKQFETVDDYLKSIKKKQEEWRIVFIITAVIYLLGGIILLIFSEARIQPWAVKKKNSEGEQKMAASTTLEDRF